MHINCVLKARLINVIWLLCVSGNPTQVAMMMKSDARADVLAENAQLADDFIKTLFATVYEVYGSSVSLCSCSLCCCFVFIQT